MQLSKTGQLLLGIYGLFTLLFAEYVMRDRASHALGTNTEGCSPGASHPSNPCCRIRQDQLNFSLMPL